MSSAEQAERAFARTLLNTIGSQPIAFANDYQQPPSNSLKRVPILAIPLPPPPEPKTQPQAGSSSSAAISLVFKSLKPPASFTISVSGTDTISSIKEQLVSQHPNAPPVDAQRFLLKGKALADNKLLKEYNIKDGDTVNLMLKPGHTWDPNAPLAPTPVTMPENIASPTPAPFGSAKLGPSPPEGTPHRGKHGRIPSVVLSPSPSSDTPGVVEKDIMLTVDPVASPRMPSPESLSSYHQVLASPEFWERFVAFLRNEFPVESDMHVAFEDFFSAAKGSITANEIAKIRDHIGIIGMAGT